MRKLPFLNYFQFCIIIFYFLIFFKNYIEDEKSILYNILTGAYVLLGVMLTFFFLLKEKHNTLLKIILSIIILTSIFVSFLGENYRLEDYPLSFCYFGLAIIPLKSRLNNKLFLWFSIIILVFFLIQMFNGKHPDMVFPRVSRNFISVFLLVGCGYHFISSYQNGKNPKFWIIIITFILSIWATGRAGIMSSALLFLFYPYILKTKRIYKVSLSLIIILSAMFSYFWFEDLLYEYGLGRFKAMGLQSDRSSMNTDYFFAVFESFKNLFFGASWKNIPSIVEVELNPHNSFIRLHSFYGLITFIMITTLIILALYNYFRKGDYVLFFLFISLLLRSYLDSTSFHGPLDPLMYFLLLYPFSHKKIV